MPSGCPGEGLVEPVVAPESLAIDHESRRSEDAESAGYIGLGLEPLVGSDLISCTDHIIHILAEGRQDMCKVSSVAQCHAV